MSEKQYTLAPDEKATQVMVGTADTLFWGALVTKEQVRLSSFLTTLAEDFVPFHNVKILFLAPAQQMAKGAAATGAVVSASSLAARSFLGRLLQNPLVMFGIGIAVGYSVHKYRKEIIGAANRVAEKGKDFVLQQRESLEDIVAETRESDA